MTTTNRTADPHRVAALKALDAANVARAMIGDEYAKPAAERDYNAIGEWRSAARHALLEAQVQAQLATGVLVVVDNAHDAALAHRTLATA